MGSRKIGYTAGVFDLFHIGHLNLLETAKKNCDYLIVAVSTDELTMQYKGTKPFIPYEERKKIIESLSCVDLVVPQINRNKIEAFHRFQFDIMFVGDDWKGDSLFEKTEYYLNQFGAEIIYLPYTKSTSSTQLKKVLEKVYKSSSEEAD